MAEVTLYCASCGKHTAHVHMVSQYATRCTVCNSQTSQLERSHVENLAYTTPDGVAGRVVSNTPDQVTFYVDSGEHKGYYHYEKGSGKKQITKA
jgi:hypothetical protein